MSIITHNPNKTQVDILANRKQNPQKRDDVLIYGRDLSKTQREALELYDAGMNVFPQPYGQKAGFPWKRLQFSRLNRNHHLYGIASLFIGYCNLAIMCGRTSDNLFVIDCETKKEFNHHLARLRERNIPIWASETKRGGHIYLRALNGEVHNIGAGELKDIEIRGRNAYVLAPPSLHPSGKKYRWICKEGDKPPLIDVNELDWIKNKDGNRVHITYEKATEYQPGIRLSNSIKLSQTAQKYLTERDCIVIGTRNNTLFKVACEFASQKIGYQQAIEKLTPKAIKSGLSNHEIEKTIKSAYSKLRQPIDFEKEEGNWFYALICLINEQKNNNVFNASQRALILALIERARIVYYHSEKNCFRASVRELATLAKLSTATVQKGLKKITETGWIEKRSSDEESLANTWQFTSEIIAKGKKHQLNTNTLEQLPQWLEYSVLLFNSDIVERQALGHGGLFLYRMMSVLDKPLMPLALSQLTGLSINQINYALSKMKLMSLVYRTNDGWFVKPLSNDELDQLATNIGVSGKSSVRSQVFLLERQLFAGKLIYYARCRRDGYSFWKKLSRQMVQYRWINDLLSDDLVQDALELGAIVYCDEGFLFERRLE